MHGYAQRSATPFSNLRNCMIKKLARLWIAHTITLFMYDGLLIVIMLFVLVELCKVQFEGKHNNSNRSSKHHSSRGPAVSLLRGPDSPSIITLAIQPLHLEGK